MVAKASQRPLCWEKNNEHKTMFNFYYLYDAVTNQTIELFSFVRTHGV